VSCLQLRLLWCGWGVPPATPVLLVTLVARRLEGVVLESPVVGLTLHAREVSLEPPRQEGLFRRRESVEPLPDLLARLADTLEEAAVVQAEARPSWRSESTWAPACPRTVPPAPCALPDDDTVAQQGGAAWEAVRPRPVLLRAVPPPVAGSNHALQGPTAVG
jgi:hypothetical protein